MHATRSSTTRRQSVRGRSIDESSVRPSPISRVRTSRRDFPYRSLSLSVPLPVRSRSISAADGAPRNPAGRRLRDPVSAHILDRPPPDGPDAGRRPVDSVDGGPGELSGLRVVREPAAGRERAGRHVRGLRGLGARARQEDGRGTVRVRARRARRPRAAARGRARARAPARQAVRRPAVGDHADPRQRALPGRPVQQRAGPVHREPDPRRAGHRALRAGAGQPLGRAVPAGRVPAVPGRRAPRAPVRISGPRRVQAVRARGQRGTRAGPRRRGPPELRQVSQVRGTAVRQVRDRRRGAPVGRARRGRHQELLGAGRRGPRRAAATAAVQEVPRRILVRR